MREIMRREQEIWQACDAIYRQSSDSDAVTGDAIVTKLLELGYKKGSSGDLYRYRKTWQQSHGFSNKQRKRPKKPIVLEPAVMQAIQVIQAQIQKEANQALEIIRANHEAKLTFMQNFYKGLEENLISLNKKVEQMAAKLAQKE